MITVEYEKVVDKKYMLTVYLIPTQNKRVVLYSVYNGISYELKTMKILKGVDNA